MSSANQTARTTRCGASAVALLAGCALALAACGSSGPSKSEYIAKANPICESARAQTGPLIQEVTKAAVGLAKGQASAVAQLSSGIGALHAIAVSAQEKLEKLKQPSGAHAAIEKFLKPFSEVVDSLAQAATMFGKGQAQQGFALLEQIRPASQLATSGAQAYGLTQCQTVLSALG